MTLNIDGDRLWRALMELAEVGAYPAGGDLRGVNRLALTDADAAGRRLVKRWFEEAGLEVRVDRIGNTIARRPGREDLAPVMSGSHIDSVPTGGAFDGALGVMGALEVVRSLNDAGVITRRAIEIAFFSDEEGARFGTDMLGSATAAGRIALEQAYALRDRDGKSVEEELRRIGFAGDAAVPMAPPHAYVELHIEQGPMLARAGVDIGVVSGVQAISWHEVSIAGKSAHAGTTPMELRIDAGFIAAKLNTHLHDMAVSGRFGPAMRATMGRVDLQPNRVNIVPGRAVCSVDLRNPDDVFMRAAEAELARYLDELSLELGARIERRQTARTPSVAFAPEVMRRIEEAARARGASTQAIVSGAGHDAQEIAALAPTAMIFIPGENDGISHNPLEYSTPEACALGCNVLCDVLLSLAE